MTREGTDGNMSKASAYLRHSSVVFLYVASLFILVNFLGKFCRTPVGWAIFAIFSLVLIRLSKGNEYAEKSTVKGILSISAAVVSLGLEAGIVTGIYSTLSEAKSGISDNCFFAVFIVIACLILSAKENRSVIGASVMMVQIPTIPN